MGSTNSQPATLTNSGNATLNITSIVAIGSGFTVTGPTAPLTLAPSETLSFFVAFTPQAVGNATGTLTLTSNGVNSPSTLALSGNGIAPTPGQLTVNPASINFGGVVVSSSSTQAITLTNTGGSVVIVSQATISGAGFNTSGLTLPLAISPGQNSSFNVQFAPASLGAAVGSLFIVSDATNSPTTIPLSGNGLAPVLQLSVNPTNINFGDVAVGASSNQAVTVTNTGNFAVNITGAPVTPPAVGFSVVGLTTGLLQPGQSRTFTARFAPTATGAVPPGTISLTGTATNSPTVFLSGNGTATAIGVLSVNPMPIDFGSVVVGSSLSQSVTLINAGNASLTIASPPAPPGGGFSFTGFTTGSLLPGQSSTFTVTFAPGAPGGPANGTISIVSNASISPTDVLLTGTGVAQALTLSMSPTSINFGDVAVGGTANQTVTMTNTGNFNVNVTAAAATGAGFNVVGFVPQTPLAPGQTSTFTARFAPGVTGAAAGIISLTSTATINPAVSLLGNGVATPVGTLTTNPTSLNFGSIVVGNTASQSVTMTNTGTASLTIASPPAPPGGGFSFTGFTTGSLLPGQSSTFTVTFAPGPPGGPASGTISIVSDASILPTDVSLTGTGVAQVLTLTVNPTNINFGDVVVLSTDSRLVTVTNTGNFAVNITGAPVTPPTAEFSVVGLTTGLLQPGQSTTFTARFAPTAPGAAPLSTISLTGTATNSPTVILSGNGVSPALLNVNPSSLDFGSVVVGNTDARSITLTNTGGVSVNVLSAAPTGTGFGISGFVAQTLLAGGSMSFTAQFTPAAAGTVPGNITITSTAVPPSNVVTLTGTGVAQVLTVSLNPSTVNFGDVTVGGGSASQTVTMTNTGNFNVNVTAAAATGAGFSVVGFVPQTPLAPGQTSTFTARFAPAVTGPAPPGTISLTSTATNNPTVSLSGNGVATPVGTLTTNPTSLNFGSIVVGNTTSQSVTMTNTGTASLTIASPPIPPGGGFSFAGFTTGSLLPGQSSTFTVTFAPGAAGPASGTISIVSNASNSPTSVALSGAGVAQILTVSLSPSTINFGNVTVGNTSNQTVTMTNTGNFNVNVTAASATGAGFSVVGFVPQTPLAPGQTSTFTARFAPAVAGAVAGTISLTSTATNNPTVSLSGTGTPPPIGTLTTNPTSINFGSIIVGNTTSQSVTLTNTGTANLTITAANVTGAGFSITPPLTLPLTLTPGQTGNFTARFAPASAGVVPGSVSLVSNASNSPTSVTLSGTGVAQILTVTLSPSTINFGSVTVGSTANQTVTMTNTGNFNINVTAAAATGAGFSVVGFVAQTPLAPGQTSTFTARFAPAVAGAAPPGTISLTSTATNNPTVSLSGTGTLPPPAVLAINPAGIDFGGVLVGSNLTRSVTLTNVGSGALTISQANVTGAVFSISGLTLPLTLNAGQNTTFTARFAPTSAGIATGSVSVVSDASNSPTTLSLTGTGTIGVSLSWDASTSVVVGYNVYRAATTGGPYVRLTASVIPGLNYIDSTALAGNTYFYVATAVDSDGIESILSNELKVILP